MTSEDLTDVSLFTFGGLRIDSRPVDQSSGRNSSDRAEYAPLRNASNYRGRSCLRNLPETKPGQSFASDTFFVISERCTVFANICECRDIYRYYFVIMKPNERYINTTHTLYVF